MKQWHYKSFSTYGEMCKFLNKHNLQYDEFKFSECSTRPAYSILYLSEQPLS